MIGEQPPQNLDTVTQGVRWRTHRGEGNALPFDRLPIDVERGDDRLMPAALQLPGERNVGMKVSQRAEGGENDALADAVSPPNPAGQGRSKPSIPATIG